MNKYMKSFLHRGLVFSGFGPIITSVVFWAISLANSEVIFTGTVVLSGMLSTYFLAFIVAGASVINQIEHWPIGKRSLVHLSILYITYLVCYLVNSWIPFDWIVVLVFTLVFVLTYLVIWLIVYVSSKHTAKKMNDKLN